MKPAATWEAIGSIKPWPGNPRVNQDSIQPVADSIERFGFGAPILARADDRIIIAGHTRYQAAKLLQLDKVPVRFLDLDPARARALALADNKLGEIAGWDEAALADVLNELEADGLDLAGLGWSDDELEGLLASPEDDVPADDGEPIAPPVDPVSVAGEVYQLGPHRLICGDCRDPAIVAKLIGDRRVNVAFTSPPYASQRKYDESSGFKPIKPESYVDWFEAVQANVRASLAGDGSWFVNIKAHCEDGQRSLYVHDLTLAHVRRWGWRFVDELCWRKDPMPGKYGARFKNGFEPVFHFSQSTPKLIFANVSTLSDRLPGGGGSSWARAQGSSETILSRKSGLARPSNVVDIRGKAARIGHSASFPVGLPAFFIKAYSDPGDIIFDPFMGSGTTMIAAANEKRIAMGCEISPAYCDTIRQRWYRWCVKNEVDPGPDALECEA